MSLITVICSLKELKSELKNDRSPTKKELERQLTFIY